MTSPPSVLFEDLHLLVVAKPAPLLTQAPPGIPSLEEWAKGYIKATYAKPAGVYLAVPHRLDRAVSGVVCFIRNTKAAQRVQKQFEERAVKKTYWALVEGELQGEGEWTDWIRKVEGEPRAERGGPEDKHAHLRYRSLEPLTSHRVYPGGVAEANLVELAPTTGRMHQLRVQCAWRGHPVLGDALYGSTTPFGPPTESERERVIALHARKLELTHPFSGQTLMFEAPLPAYWDIIA